MRWKAAWGCTFVNFGELGGHPVSAAHHSLQNGAPGMNYWPQKPVESVMVLGKATLALTFTGTGTRLKLVRKTGL